MMTTLYVLHFMVCFVLIAVVLLQRGKGADLGAALGGGGANTVFGGRGAGNFLTKITAGSAAIFMSTSLSLAYLGTQEAGVVLFGDDDVLVEETLPGETATSADGTAGDEAAGLEEIDPADLGGLEEIDPVEPEGLEDSDP
jgi:preprotein translocase subunit SecG